MEFNKTTALTELSIVGQKRKYPSDINTSNNGLNKLRNYPVLYVQLKTCRKCQSHTKGI